jgi:hypothetical protein
VEVSDPGSLAKAILELEKQMRAAAKRVPPLCAAALVVCG